MPWRVQIPIYLTGFFSNSLNDVAGIVLPLWLHGQNTSAATVGLVIGVDRKGDAESLSKNGADLVVTDLAELMP